MRRDDDRDHVSRAKQQRRREKEDRRGVVRLVLGTLDLELLRDGRGHQQHECLRSQLQPRRRQQDAGEAAHDGGREHSGDVDPGDAGQISHGASLSGRPGLGPRWRFLAAPDQ